MTEENNDEQFLEEFRRWLQETRQEAARANLGDGVPPGQPTGDLNSDSQPPYRANDSAPVKHQEPQVGLYRLVEEFTALRQELKLQTRELSSAGRTPRSSFEFVGRSGRNVSIGCSQTKCRSFGRRKTNCQRLCRIG